MSEVIVRMDMPENCWCCPNGQPISDLYDALTIAIEALERSEDDTSN